MPQLRICSYNVHGWATANMQRNPLLVADTLQPLQADIVGMQEVFHPKGKDAESTSLGMVADKIGHTELKFGSNHSGTFGNSITSKLKVLNTGVAPLGMHHGNGRCLIAVVVEVPEFGPFGVVNLHLDHISEGSRVSQLQKALEWLQKWSPLKDTPYVVMGDFNALRKADYSDSKWQAIEAHRNGNGWETPMSDATLLMEKAGFIDTMSARNPKAVSKTLQQTQGSSRVPPTCWAGTRIDYIWYKPQEGVKVVDTQVVQSDASDHDVVLADFELQAGPVAEAQRLASSETCSVENN